MTVTPQSSARARGCRVYRHASQPGAGAQAPSLQGQNFPVLLEKSSRPAERRWEALSPGFSPAPTRSRATQGSGLVRGAARSCSSGFSGIAGRARGAGPLLSGISYFRSCIYIPGAAARCCQMPARHPARAPGPTCCPRTPGKVAVGGHQTCQALCPLPKCPESWTETQGEAGPGLGLGRDRGGGLAAGPEGAACHFPNPLKSPSLGALSPPPTAPPCMAASSLAREER